jgi:quinol monooxygenase YgiN
MCPADGGAAGGRRVRIGPSLPAAVAARPRRSFVIIAIVDFSTAAADRPAALAQLDGERDQVRAMPGNLDFRVYASRRDETGVSVVHEWEDEASFAEYLGSDSFARSGEVLRPLMIGAPVSRRFGAELRETVA